MSIFKSALILASLATAASFAATPKPDLTSPFILDDFNNTYGDPANRNYPGAVKSYVDNNNVYTGGDGYWWIYGDKGTKILGGVDGDSLFSTPDTSNMEKMVEAGAMHVKFKVEQSTATYPGAEIGCNILDDAGSFDFSKLTSIFIKAKGTGTVRISLQSQNILEAKDWGHCSKAVKLSSSYTNISIPVADLEPAPYSASADAGVTWNDSKKSVKGFSIKTESSKDAEIWVDSIVFVGMTYGDIIKASSVRPMSMKAGSSANMFSISNSAISYSIPKTQDVSFSIVDLKGNLIQQLYKGSVAAGNHSIVIPKTLSAGQYLVKMNSANGTASQNFSIVK